MEKTYNRLVDLLPGLGTVAEQGAKRPDSIGLIGTRRVVVGEVEAGQIGVEKPDDHGFIIKKNRGLIHKGKNLF